MNRYKKDDHARAAKSLARSFVVQIGIANRIEHRVSRMEAFAKEFGDPSDLLQAELLRSAWKEEQEARAAEGRCHACGYKDWHARACPGHEAAESEAVDAAERR